MANHEHEWTRDPKPAPTDQNPEPQYPERATCACGAVCQVGETSTHRRTWEVFAEAPPAPLPR